MTQDKTFKMRCDSLRADLKRKVEKPNYLVIKLSYSIAYVFPYAEGIAFLELLGKAENWNNDRDVSYPDIIPFDSRKDDLDIYIINEDEYLDRKMSHILQRSLNEEVSYDNNPFP